MAYRVPLTRYRKINIVTDILAVPLEEVKLHCGVETESFTPKLEYLIKTACDQFEALTGKPVLNALYRVSLDSWPSKKNDQWWNGVQEGHFIDFQETSLEFFNGGGFQNGAFNFLVNWIKTYDDLNAETVFPLTSYHIDPYKNQIVLKQGVTPPSGTRSINPIEFEIIAGYGESESTIPMMIKEGIKSFVAHYLENAGDGINTEASLSSGGLGGLPLATANFWRSFVPVLL